MNTKIPTYLALTAGLIGCGDSTPQEPKKVEEVIQKVEEVILNPVEEIRGLIELVKADPTESYEPSGLSTGANPVPSGVLKYIKELDLADGKWPVRIVYTDATNDGKIGKGDNLEISIDRLRELFVDKDVDGFLGPKQAIYEQRAIVMGRLDIPMSQKTWKPDQTRFVNEQYVKTVRKLRKHLAKKRR